jgi:predicted unusual protein kinase regulating ubiquinone biosynthesis (AarF/ABC1/UbiB family)
MRRWHQASQQPDATTAELHLGTYFGEFIAAIRRNNVQMSMDTLLFWRAILTLDATALRFGNRFDLLTALREFFKEVRPSPLERFISLTTDRSVALSLLNTKWKAPGQIQVLSAQLARREYRLPILLSVNDTRQSTNANIRLLALVLIGTTAVLLVKSFAGVLGLTLVWLITLTLATTILTRLIRR